jgi:hypothetical protein
MRARDKCELATCCFPDLALIKRMPIPAHSDDTDLQQTAGGDREGPLEPNIDRARVTHTNGRISGLDLWILPNFLDLPMRGKPRKTT